MSKAFEDTRICLIPALFFPEALSIRLWHERRWPGEKFQFGDAARMEKNTRIDDVPAQLHQARMGTALGRLHEASVPRYIGNQNRRNLAFHPRTLSHWSPPNLLTSF